MLSRIVDLLIRIYTCTEYILKRCHRCHKHLSSELFSDNWKQSVEQLLFSKELYLGCRNSKEIFPKIRSSKFKADLKEFETIGSSYYN